MDPDFVKHLLLTVLRMSAECAVLPLAYISVSVMFCFECSLPEGSPTLQVIASRL